MGGVLVCLLFLVFSFWCINFIIGLVLLLIVAERYRLWGLGPVLGDYSSEGSDGRLIAVVTWLWLCVTVVSIVVSIHYARLKRIDNLERKPLLG